VFLNRLRRLSPVAPILVLRKESRTAETTEGMLRGDFLISDVQNSRDLKIVDAVREVLPIAPCEHESEDADTALVRDVIRVVSENYSDSDIDLDQVADQLSISPTKLSRTLNRTAHVRFRQLLRQIRIEEAKRLLTTGRLSVKEIAIRVGFSDSHYFSRIFKQMTGTPPTEYEVATELIFDR
jgi:two-component system response regulator YesN